jgi:tetratricopeptide (TPR) repeat protein
MRLSELANKVERKLVLRARRTCPASAAEVTPVMGVVDGRALAEMPHSQEHIVEAVGAVAFVGKKGSSFAVPLVSGTAALIAQVLSTYPSNIAKHSPGKIVAGRPSALFRRNFRDISFYLFDLQSLFSRPDRPDPVSCPNLAEVYKAIGMPEKAEPLFIQDLQFHMLLGLKGFSSAKKSYESLQDLYSTASDREKVAALEKIWFDYVLRTQVPEELEKTAEVFNQLGIRYLKSHKTTNAKNEFLRCVTFLEMVLGPNHPKLGQRLLNLVEASLKDNDPETAKNAITHAFSIFGNAKEKTKELATTHDYLGVLLAGYGQFEKAEHCHQSALAIYDELDRPNDPEAAVTLRNYADLLIQLKRPAEARELLDRADKIDGMVNGA